MGYLKKYVAKYYKMFLVAVFFLSVEAVCELLQPAMLSKIVDVGIRNRDLPYVLRTGGLMLGAFFMANDYTTSPVTFKGRIIMGAGCGLLTSVIRLFGGYPEGVSYSILLMNLAVPMIDRYIIPRSFGGVVKNA